MYVAVLCVQDVAHIHSLRWRKPERVAEHAWEIPARSCKCLLLCNKMQRRMDNSNNNVPTGAKRSFCLQQISRSIWQIWQFLFPSPVRLDPFASAAAPRATGCHRWPQAPGPVHHHAPGMDPLGRGHMTTPGWQPDPNLITWSDAKTNFHLTKFPVNWCLNVC